MTDILELDALWLLIPAYNAGLSLFYLLDKTKEFIPLERTVIVDDGSNDDTKETIKKLRCVLLSHSINIGKGAALRTGFEYILKNEGKWILTMDADGQHPPEFIPLFLKLARTEKYDLIIGARKRNSYMPLDRRFSNWATSGILSLLTGERILDSQCGFRLIRSSLIKGINFNTKKFEFETELLLRLIKKGAKIGWVNIPTEYKNEFSAIRRLPDTLRFIKLIISHITGTLY